MRYLLKGNNMLEKNTESKNFSRVALGRQAEYYTAVTLWVDYQIVTFPSPNPQYDLLTANGTAIEVKTNKSRSWQLSSKQRNQNFCDFLVLWYKEIPFIVLYTEVLGKETISFFEISQFKDAWYLIMEAE